MRSYRRRRGAQARIHRFILIAEVFDKLESQQISVETESALHIFHVDHGMIESKFPVSIQGDGSLVLWWPRVFGTRVLRRAWRRSPLRRGFLAGWLLHWVVSTKQRKYRRGYRSCQGRSFAPSKISEIDWYCVYACPAIMMCFPFE